MPRIVLGIACAIAMLAAASPALSATLGPILPEQTFQRSTSGSGAWRLYHHGVDRLYGQIVLPLQDGRVLVTSGGAIASGRSSLVAKTEIFDPKTGVWVQAGDIPVPGVGQSAVQLNDGTVVVAGGAGLAPDQYSAAPVYSVTELLSPSTGTWTRAGDLRRARESAAMVLLSNGLALILGGAGAASPPSPASTTGPVAPGSAGSSEGPALSSTELFDPASRSWRTAGSLISARSSPAATVLADGKVLVMGGDGPIGADEANLLQPYQQFGGPVTNGPVLTSELYDPAVGSWHSFHLSFPIGYDQQLVTSAYRATSGLVVGMSTDLVNAAGVGLRPGVPPQRYPFTLNVSTGEISIGPADPDTLPSAPVRTITIGVPAGVLTDGRLVIAGPGNDYFYAPQSRSWSKIPSSPLSSGVGGSPPVVSMSGLVLVHVGDQWAIFNPDAAALTSPSAKSPGGPGLAWWLTAAVIALALFAASQFIVLRLVRDRRSRQQAR